MRKRDPKVARGTQSISYDCFREVPGSESLRSTQPGVFSDLMHDVGLNDDRPGRIT